MNKLIKLDECQKIIKAKNLNDGELRILLDHILTVMGYVIVNEKTPDYSSIMIVREAKIIK